MSKNIDDYTETIFDLCYSYKQEGLGRLYLDDGTRIIVSFYCEHQGGLEGYYCDRYEGSVYIDNEAYAFSIVDSFCNETRFEIERDEGDDFIKGDDDYIDPVEDEEKDVAKLSERIYNEESTKQISINKGENNMTNLRTINLTLVDNNPNLKAAEKVVFQQLNYMTEHSDDQSIQQILMSGKVAEALAEHNKKRVKVVDKDILRSTGREVMLEEVEIFSLNWQIVRVA